MSIRVKELKEFLENFPDDGEIWVEASGLSNVVEQLAPLNSGKDVLLRLSPNVSFRTRLHLYLDTLENKQ